MTIMGHEVESLPPLTPPQEGIVAEYTKAVRAGKSEVMRLLRLDE